MNFPSFMICLSEHHHVLASGPLPGAARVVPHVWHSSVDDTNSCKSSKWNLREIDLLHQVSQRTVDKLIFAILLAVYLSSSIHLHGTYRQADGI